MASAGPLEERSVCTTVRFNRKFSGSMLLCVCAFFDRATRQTPPPHLKDASPLQQLFTNSDFQKKNPHNTLWFILSSHVRTPVGINIGTIGHLSKLTFVDGSHDNKCSFGEEREHLVSTI